MFQYVAITDGTTTVELTDGINYALISYAPIVAPIRDGLLGGDGQYSDVTESLTFHAIGCTAAEAYAAAAAVNALLDQARRWWMGQSVAAVRLVVQPQGSTIGQVSVVLKGRAPGGPSNITLPALYHAYYSKYVIQNITLQVVRHGLFLGALESASAAAANNPSVRTITMPSTPAVPGPLRLDFTGFAVSAGGAIDIPAGFLFVGPNNAFSLQEAESPVATTLAAGATYVSTADAAARASAGSVGRLNHAASALNAESIISFTPSAALQAANMIGVYCTYRNNSASTWSIRASSYIGSVAALAYTPTQQIPAGPGNPTTIFLGALAAQVINGTSFIRVNINAAITLISGAGTLDLDTIVLADLSTGATYVIAINGSLSNVGVGLGGSALTLAIENKPQTFITPNVRIDAAAGFFVPQTPGGVTALTSKSAIIQAIWYATHLFGGITPYWTTQNAAGAAILQIGVNITRQLASLVPQ
jgi:hypothetical protein